MIESPHVGQLVRFHKGKEVLKGTIETLSTCKRYAIVAAWARKSGRTTVLVKDLEDGAEKKT